MEDDNFAVKKAKAIGPQPLLPGRGGIERMNGVASVEDTWVR
jgi:hypothetical protein